MADIFQRDVLWKVRRDTEVSKEIYSLHKTLHKNKINKLLWSVVSIVVIFGLEYFGIFNSIKISLKYLKNIF